MELSPRLYHWFVRPQWFTKLYINNTIKSLLVDFDFHDKIVLDFGCGIGSSSFMFNPNNYIGIDYDFKRIDYARHLYPNYKFKVLQGNILPFFNKCIDYILIIAVLHHISSQELSGYLQEFHRVLKPDGKIIVIEPCFFEKTHFNNWFMALFDKGKYIRSEYDYLRMFNNHYYEIETVKRLKKCFFYNELFFTVAPKS